MIYAWGLRSGIICSWGLRALSCPPATNANAGKDACVSLKPQLIYHFYCTENKKKKSH